MILAALLAAATLSSTDAIAILLNSPSASSRSRYAAAMEMVRKDAEEGKPLQQFVFGITTDIIVGFPGETEDDFGESLDIVRQAEFGRTHVFRYSPRKGTAGAAMKDAIPEKVKKDRADALESLGEETAQRFIEANLGIAHTVLIEESRDGYATGYTGNYIKVYIEDTGNMIAADALYEVTLTGLFRDGALAVLNISS